MSSITNQSIYFKSFVSENNIVWLKKLHYLIYEKFVKEYLTFPMAKISILYK